MHSDERQAIVEHLLAQHRAIDRMLCEARCDLIACRGPDVDAKREDVAAVLQRIRTAIVHHFEQEEAGGCLEEAVLQCPQLSHEADRLEKEHSGLLLMIDELIALAQSPADKTHVEAKFERGFEKFYAEIRNHEAAENELVRQGLGATLDAEECATTPPVDY